MFERFTGEARRVVVLAQEEARMLGHNYIGTEHLLLALLALGDGVACTALNARGVTLDGVRLAVDRLVGRGDEGASEGHIPLTPRSKKVLELSLRQALQLGHSYIGTRHLLLGLLREGEGAAVQVLTDLGVDLNDLRRKVISLSAREASELRLPRPAPSRAAGGDIMAALADIGDRLTAIEEHLGIKRPSAGGPAGPAGEASPAEADFEDKAGPAAGESDA